MKHIKNKTKGSGINGISLVINSNIKYSSPSKYSINSKTTKNIENKKFSNTNKKEKHNKISLNEIEKVEKNQKIKQKKKEKQTLLIHEKDSNKKENKIVISTSQNFTPNKRKHFRLSEIKTQKKEKWIPFGKLNINESEFNKNNYFVKGNRLVYQCQNNKSNKLSNINSLILNFKKDIPNYQHRIQSVTYKKSANNIDNNSYIVSQKRSTLKGKKEILIKRNNANKKHNDYNCDNYTIKIGKNKNFSIKKKIKDNYIFHNEINKKYFKSYIITKNSISFIKNNLKINDFKKSNSKKMSREKKLRNINNINNKNNSENKTNSNKTPKNMNKEKLINSKVKSYKNIKDNKKDGVNKKRTIPSLTTKKKSKKPKIFFDKNNIHQMTDFSESFNNTSVPIAINKIKLNLNKKFKNNTSKERDGNLREKDEEEIQIIKKIKKNINSKKSKSSKNKTIKVKRENNKNLEYPRINSHKILITNININYYKDINDSNKKEENIDNFYLNSDEIRNTNLILNLNESKIDLEKAYLLEEKIRKILAKINKYEICDEECQNFITFYFSVNFHRKVLELFENCKNQEKISNYMKIELLCYLICYDISFSENFNQASILLKTIINLLHDNYLILMAYILYLNNDKNNENKIADNLWSNKIEKIIENEIKIKLTPQDMNENSIISIIINTYNTIINYYNMIIDNLYLLNNANSNDNIDNNFINIEYMIPNCLQLDLNKIDCVEKSKIISLFFTQAYKLLTSCYSFKNLKLFFYLFLNNPKYNSKKNTTNNNKNLGNNNNNLSQYYLPPIKSGFKYSLLINLDETLIYNDNGKIVLRPNLYKFLGMMKELFELIAFSFESNSFVDSIIEIIEKKNKYFDYILYANQFTLNNNGKLVKDLESIGRDLKNIIVIDSKFHLDKKYKNNFILIKAFYGNELIDINLLKILGYILQNIKKENYEDDIRISIIKHKNSIKTYLI